MKYSTLAFLVCVSVGTYAQSPVPEVTLVKQVPYTPVRNQGSTGTCWSFSTTSLIESQTIKNGLGEFDLSEIFTARNIYIEKAKNYMFRQGNAQFGPGGLGHDVIRAVATYGAVPESVYSGLLLGNKNHNHNVLDSKLKTYLDSLLKSRPLPADWLKGFENILDDHLGKPPEKFMYKERQYTPLSFASEVLHFTPDDYINITSFTHHPFYTSFIVEVPDNFSNGVYYNLPINDMLTLTEQAINKGFSIMWDADVSNAFFMQRNGFAMQWPDAQHLPTVIDPDGQEMKYDQSARQSLFENLTTQDDHLMHIVGIEKSKGGKKFFLVKNSWGEVGPYKGMINVSEAYFAINTITLVVPKAALDASVKTKLGIK